MSEEDDWFERALRETDGESDERPVGEAEHGSDDEAETEGAARERGGVVDETEGAAEGAKGAENAADGVDAPGDGVAEREFDDPAVELGASRDDAESADPFGGAVGEPDANADDGDLFGGGAGDTGAGGDDAGSDDEAYPPGETTDDAGPFGGAEESGGDRPADEPAADGVPADAFGDVDDGGGEFGSFGGEDPFGGGSDAAASADSPPDADAGSGGGTDPFGADDPSGGSRGDGGTGGGAGGGTGGGGGGDDPFGGYRGAASAGDDDFGFGDLAGEAGGGGETTDFDVDPDEFESEIDRTDIGIKGLDDMILGGVPSRSLLSVIGGAGTGKTTFALQFLNHALESGNKGIYITLEQTRESILDTAAEKGWSFREHAAEDRLAVVAIDPIEMANSLASIRNDLVRLIAEFDADRLVLDSVSLLEMMYDHPAKRRSEVFGFTRSLKEAGVTTLLTSEASEDTPYASRHGIVEYLTDAVFVLQYVRGSDFRETRLAVEIQKIRDANHSRETKPYDITDTGISVYDQANIF